MSTSSPTSTCPLSRRPLLLPTSTWLPLSIPSWLMMCYRYKTNKRVVIRRHRRDVNELSNEYLPPVQEAVAPSNEYLAPAVDTVLADDGYRYKTNKRVVIRRHRRDVNELSNEYLPPVQEAVAPSNEYLAPAVDTVLADDGYRYKTNKRVVIRRHRRDVNELSNEYLPPVQEAVAPSNEYLDSRCRHLSWLMMAYCYKTNKRVGDPFVIVVMSIELSNEYLPSVQEAVAPSTST
ncbi:GL17903 [Drosophila persimilis]|uniref:GL17903 n=1 Tax=Drosophila persimilis TaxID=7234 RepID=B4H1T9_DROPE|nr:GL17903 [Drosophila persimilis]